MGANNTHQSNYNYSQINTKYMHHLNLISNDNESHKDTETGTYPETLGGGGDQVIMNQCQVTDDNNNNINDAETLLNKVIYSLIN